MEAEPEPVVPVQLSDKVEEEVEDDYGLETPVRKHRIHWIVPTAVAVIIILSLVFYVRNCCPEKVDSPELTVDSQQSAVDSAGPVTTAQPEGTASDSIRQPEIDHRPSTIDNRQSIPTHLFKLAREVYGNPYLWVLIYSENRDKIPDPDMLISGRELVIPKLEGTPERLTRNDSLAVSEGYRLLYEYFKAKEDTRTGDFFKAMKRYRPK